MPLLVFFPLSHRRSCEATRNNSQQNGYTQTDVYPELRRRTQLGGRGLGAHEKLYFAGCLSAWALHWLCCPCMEATGSPGFGELRRGGSPGGSWKPMPRTKKGDSTGERAARVCSAALRPRPIGQRSVPDRLRPVRLFSPWASV